MLKVRKIIILKVDIDVYLIFSGNNTYNATKTSFSYKSFYISGKIVHFAYPDSEIAHFDLLPTR